VRLRESYEGKRDGEGARAIKGMAHAVLRGAGV